MYSENNLTGQIVQKVVYVVNDVGHRLVDQFVSNDDRAEIVYRSEENPHYRCVERVETQDQLTVDVDQAYSMYVPANMGYAVRPMVEVVQ